MNKVILMGRLTKDPDIRYSQVGADTLANARFTLAVDRPIKTENQQTADFISCVAFGKNAEFYEKYTHKGIKLLIEGRLQTGSYTNKEGVKIYTTDVIVTNQEFCESKVTQQNTTPKSKQTQTDNNGYMNIPNYVDDGLPFK